MLTKKNYLHQN